MKTCEAPRHARSAVVYEDERGCPLCAILGENGARLRKKSPPQRTYDPRLAIAVAHAGPGKPLRKFADLAVGRRVDSRGRVR